MRFKEGDMVVPISKSIGTSLENCPYWSRAKRKNQPYLYVTCVKSTFYNCSDTENPFDEGNHYRDTDLIPYQMVKEKAFELLVQGKITESQYEEYTR